MSLSGLLAVTRPINACAAGGLTFTGAYVGGGLVSENIVAVTIAVAATILATGGGNAINDYFDREIDRINRPDRPIPSGDITPRVTLVFSLLLFIIAIGLVLLLPLLAIVIAGINLVLLLTYTSVFKGLPGAGNLVVAVLGGSTFLFGGAAAGQIGPAAVLFVLAALATFSREIIKDIEDIDGDRAEGLVTLPIWIGQRKALWIAGCVLVIAILASPIPFIRGEFGWQYLPGLGVANGIMLWGLVVSFTHAGRGQQLLKYGMFLAAIAFVIGRATI